MCAHSPEGPVSRAQGRTGTKHPQNALTLTRGALLEEKFSMLRVSYAYPCHDKNTATQTRAKHSRTESNTYMVNPNQDKDVPGDSFYSRDS